MNKLPTDHIDFKPSGKAIVAGTRISVQFLSHFTHDPEWSVERICQTYQLTPAQVHAAWSYYYDHQTEIDQHSEAEENFTRPDEAEAQARVEAMKQRYYAKHGITVAEAVERELADLTTAEEQNS